jgi:uncharacterized glyoxalase superfamily protein PhnB
VLVYPDVREAVAWLTDVFGFSERPRMHAHCARTRAHGARILTEATDFEYGERQYNTEDPFGHQWTFSETLADVAPRLSMAGASGGLSTLTGTSGKKATGTWPPKLD